jgi:hypothetical protein
LQVKIEDCEEDGAGSDGARVLRNAGMDPQPDPTHASVKLEEVRFALKPCSIEALIDVCCKYNHNKLNPLGILQIETENHKFVGPHNFEALFLVLMKF